MRSATTPRPRATAASASPATTSSRWRSPACSPASQGALDVIGWEFRVDTTQISASTVGFVGIAVALLGRNTAVGVGLAALLFAALDTGTASRNLDPSYFPPDLASSLAIIIQGLIVLFVGADVIVLLALRRLKRKREARSPG